MKTVIECGHCQIKFKIDLNTIPDTGRSNGCPNCGRPVHIPSPDEMVLEPCDDDVGGGKRSTVEPVLPMLDLPVLIDPPPVPGARSQKERQRLLRWSVALAVGLLLALAVSGGRQYLGLRQSLMQAQGNLMATSQSMQSERERFKQLEQRHIQLRQEQAQRHLSEVRQVAARGLRLLEEERKNRAWDVRELKEENLKLRAQIRRLEKKSAQHAASKGGAAPPRGCINGNCENGRGTWLAENGDKYIGGWKDGKRHGKGVLYLANGDLFVGRWLFGQHLGRGDWRLKIADFMADSDHPIQSDHRYSQRDLDRIAEDKRAYQRQRMLDRSS